MSTVAQVIDRIYREFLAPADEQPTRFTLAADITSGADTFTVDAAFLTPEEEDLFGPGTIVEIESELVQVGGYDEAAHVASSVKRAVLGTTAAAHVAGVYGVVAPEYPRKVVFDAVADAVVGLYPSLYAVTSTAVAFSSTTYTEVAATVMEPMYLYGRSSGATNYGRWTNIEFLDNFGPSSTGKAIYAPVDGSGYLVHKARFARPANETVDLVATTGLQDDWEQIVVVFATAHLIAGKDLSQRQQEFITNQLGAQSYPVLTPTRIRASLLDYGEYLLAKAQKNLRSRNPATVHRVTVLPS